MGPDRRLELADAAVGQLAEAAALAVAELVRQATSATKESDRLRAALGLIDRFVKLQAHAELARRVGELERLAAESRPATKGK